MSDEQFNGQGSMIVALEAVKRLMRYCGQDPDKREGIQETPLRVVKAFEQFTAGYWQKPEDVLKVFEDGAERTDSLVLVKDIEMWSLCEHHLLPFFGVVHIGYVPDGKVVGLSKMKRLTDVFARRFQVQERLTQQIADAFMEHVQPKGVGVVIQARHTCMEARGVCTHGSTTVTSALRGCVIDEPDCRSEFLELAKKDRVI